MPTLTGRVVDKFTGEGVPAEIEIDGTRAYADSEGAFSVSLPPGTYTVRVYAEGYEPESRAVSLVGERYITIFLTPIVEVLK